MSAEEFWKDDPQLFVAYRTSFVNKEKRQMEKVDYICWLQGLYNHDGNSKLFASLKQFIGNLIASMFKGSKDNTTIDTYPIKPYSELEKDRKKQEKENEQKKIQNEKYEEFHNSLIYFGTLKQQYINRLRNKK